MSRKACALLALAAIAALGAPASAGARWTHPIPIESGAASPYAPQALAVAGRGDAAVAWETVRSQPPSSMWKKCAFEEPRPATCNPIVAVKLAIWTANREKLIRTLWQQRVNPSIEIAVQIAHGEATVAWSYEELSGNAQILRVAYGPLKGRWHPSRVLGHYSDLWFTGGRSAYPQLALAPDGTVLAAWSACRSVKACPRPTGGLELAWRSPGHGFGAPQLVREAPEGARPVFDVTGAAYLYSPCSGRVMLTAPRSRHFARSVTLARGPVSELSLGTSGAGEGLATWVAGACSSDQAVGNTPGAVLASTLRGGVFSAPQVLTPGGAQAYRARSAAVPGGGIASWATTGSNGVAVPTTRFVGTPGPFAPVPSNSVPLTSTGGGDVLFTNAGIWPAAPGEQLVLPRRGAPAEPAPSVTGIMAASPYARIAADAWYSNGLKLSVWRSELLP